MSIPSHKRNFPVTLDRAMLSRLDGIAKGCHLHRSSVLSGLIAEGLESLEARYERAPDDLRLELVEAVHALRRETARRRMWELFERTQCLTLEARQRSVVEARRQAEREVGLPAGTLGRPKPTTRRRRLQDDQDAQQASSPCSQPPVAADHATDEQRVENAEGQRVVVESGDTDRCSPLPIEPAPAHRRQCVAEGSDLQPGGDPAKSKIKAARKRPFRKKRRGPHRTALPRARRAYELRLVEGIGWNEIADEVGYSSKHGGQSAKEMAKRYALQHGHHWPLR